MTTKCISSTDTQKSFRALLQDAGMNDTSVLTNDGMRNSSIIIPEDVYDSTDETLYLTSGENGRVLQRSARDAAKGKSRPFSLQELDDMLK